MRSVPVRRGAAAVAITGGALSLMGAASPVVPPTADDLADVAQRTDRPVAAPEDAPPLGTPLLTDGGAVLLPAVAPIPPAPDVLDDPSALVKAVQLAEEQIARAEAERLAAEERARAEAARAEAAAAEAAEAAAAAAEEAERRTSVDADCGIDTGQLGAVKSYVREAAEFLGCLFGEPTMHGVAGRAGTSDHPSGKAVDFMVDRATGDQLAACALENMSALGISYVIWEQRINTGDGWELMEDRGGATANHFDHVHISFDDAGGGDLGGC